MSRRKAGRTMPLYMILVEGPTADDAKPVLAVSDPTLIRAVLAEIARFDRWSKSEGHQEGMEGHRRPLHIINRDEQTGKMPKGAGDDKS